MESKELTPIIAEVMNVELVINDALEKGNVTKAIITGLKEKYGALSINGQDDREGYKEVVEARKECKSWRVRAKKICEKGREDAVAVQKAWIAKEKEVTGEIGEIEDYLEKQEKEYDAEKERIKAELKAKNDNQFANRSIELSKLGASLIGTSFVLEDVSIESTLVREADEALYQSDILPKYKAIFGKAEEVRIVIQKEKDEAEEKLRQERVLFEQQQAELKRQQEEMNARKEEEERQRQEELNKKWKEEKEKQQAEINRRCSQLQELGMVYNFNSASYVFQDVNVNSPTEICLFNDEEWKALIEKITPVIQQRKEAAAEKLKEEQEAEKQSAIEAAVKRDRELAAEQQRKADAEREAEELRKKEEAEKASDKDKWGAFIEQVEALEFPTVTGRAYKAKLKLAQEKINEIYSL